MRKARKTGFAIIALGVLACAAALIFSEDLTPELGLRWNLENAEVVLADEVKQTVMDLAEFRKRYPQYNDLEGEEVASRLHARYFDKMPEAEFKRAFLVPDASASGGEKPGGDPVMIRGDLAEIRPVNQLMRSVFTSDAIDFGLVTFERRRSAFPLRYTLYAGLGLLAAGIVLTAAPGGTKRA